MRPIKLELPTAANGHQAQEALRALTRSPQAQWFLGAYPLPQLSLAQLQGQFLTLSPDASDSQSEALVRLSFLHGPDSQRSLLLGRGVWSLGRSGPDIRVDDPAMEAVEGKLSLEPAGIFFEGRAGRRKLEVGQPLLLGSSVLVVDPLSAQLPLPYAEPEPQILDLPQGRSRLLTYLLASFPLVLGLLIAWLTGHWLIALLAIASAGMILLQSLFSTPEGPKARKLIGQAVEAEVAWARSCRPSLGLGSSVYRVGRGHRPARIQTKQGELPHLPQLTHVPCSLASEQLASFFTQVPLASQRLLLAQLAASGQALGLFLPVTSSASFLALAEPLLLLPQVRLFTDLNQAKKWKGYLFLEDPVGGLPTGFDSCLFLLFQAQQAERTDPLQLLGQDWSWIQLDGISSATYLKTLAQVYQLTSPRGVEGRSLGARSSQLPVFRPPSLGQVQESEDIRFYLGFDPDSGQPLSLSFQQDGPHFLCAGTTGSGKSYLLRTILLSLLLRYPAERLNLLLFDFKGGAAFNPLRSFPQVKSMISDLDQSSLERTLKYLQADLKKREELFASLGVSSYQDYLALEGLSGERLPEVLICADEFKILVEDYPAIMQELMRVATVGRSLGYHLLLATQRPQGAVSADIRANISSSICLRVISEQDSYNVLKSDQAALIPASQPGRGLVRDADQNLLPFQAPLLDGLYLPQESRQASASFLLDEAGSNETQGSKGLSDQDLEEISQQAAQLLEPTAYSPVLAELIPPLLTEQKHLPDQGLYLADLEVAELYHQSPWLWQTQDGPLLFLGEPAQRKSYLFSWLRQALYQGYRLLAFSSSQALVQELEQELESKYPDQVLVYSPSSLDFFCSILADQQGLQEAPTLLLLDGFDQFLDLIQTMPDRLNQLAELLQAQGSGHLGILCLAQALPRGPFLHLFKHLIWTGKALEQDPLRSHSAAYSPPPPGFLALEGALVEEVSAKKVSLGLLAPTRFEPSSGVKKAKAASLPAQWKELPAQLSYQEFAHVTTDSHEAERREAAVCLGLGIKRQQVLLPLSGSRRIIPISGSRGSGKSQTLEAICQLNPQQPTLLIRGREELSLPQLQQRLASRPEKTSDLLLLIDDLDQLARPLQEELLRQAGSFYGLVATYTPWPQWAASPLLASLSGSDRGIFLGQQSQQLGGPLLYPQLPLTAKTSGQLPAGRALLLDGSRLEALQIPVGT